MKRLLTVLLISCCMPSINGQKEKPEIDKMYFLIGTLGDYMGREKYPEIENRVDLYYKGANSLINYIILNFKDSFPDLRLDSTKYMGIEDRYFLFSPSLSNKINDFYIYTPAKRLVKKADKPDFGKLNLDSLTKTKDFFTEYFDTVYTGSIKTEIFNNNVQKLSFISGVYTRFHDSQDSRYCIKIFNSVSKAKVCAELLKEINCTDIEYKILPNIPTCHLIYFTPTEELLKYINAYSYLQ